MTYIAYLDEFGHIAPTSTGHTRSHNDSPSVWLSWHRPALDEARVFATWFFQRKCDLLAFEIEKAGEHPAIWEKKGSSLYTARNVTKFSVLRGGDRVTVLVIGESHNKQHMSLYGYPRDTTPALGRRTRDENLIVFEKRLVQPYPYKPHSHPCAD